MEDVPFSRERNQKALWWEFGIGGQCDKISVDSVVTVGIDSISTCCADLGGT